MPSFSLNIRSQLFQTLQTCDGISIDNLHLKLQSKFPDAKISKSDLGQFLTSWTHVIAQDPRTLLWSAIKPIEVTPPSKESDKLFSMDKATHSSLSRNPRFQLGATHKKIKSLFEATPGGKIYLRVLVREVGLPKKDVNRCLYDMQNQGLVAKIQDMPPQWQWQNHGKRTAQLSPPKHHTQPNALLKEQNALMASITKPIFSTKETETEKLLTSAVSLSKTTSPLSNNPAFLSLDKSPTPQFPPLDKSATPEFIPLDRPSIAAKSLQSPSMTLDSTAFATLNKNPVSALMEYAQSQRKKATLEVLGASGPPHRPSFRVGAFIDGELLAEVDSPNKKDGKREAADMAMRKLNQLRAQVAPPKVSMTTAAGSAGVTSFDQIAFKAHEMWTRIAAQTTSHSLSGRKVLAALIMKTSPEDEGLVISLGTGNRCVTGQCLSLEGHTVNDSHAEVITRRGFMKFLYTQLLKYTNGDSELFEKTSNNRLKIKDNFSFHLYISTAPCGDGALFSPRMASDSEDGLMDDGIHCPEFSSKVQGIFRTKMEGGEGTIPIEADAAPQTWDGVMRGERLRTMSCSDKVCRWNVLGLQGALLSNLIEPVYLSSLTLGFLYHHGHISRAVCCRLATGDWSLTESLPGNFRLNHPRIGRVTTYDAPRETEKTKSVSVNWSHGQATAEVTDGTSGTVQFRSPKNGENISNLSKRKLYDNYIEVCRRMNCEHLIGETYLKSKKKATDYETAKQLFLRKIRDNSFGQWMKKPYEQDLFA